MKLLGLLIATGIFVAATAGFAAPIDVGPWKLEVYNETRLSERWVFDIQVTVNGANVGTITNSEDTPYSVSSDLGQSMVLGAKGRLRDGTAECWNKVIHASDLDQDMWFEWDLEFSDTQACPGDNTSL